ncbi:hypothetical protein AB0H43_09050 [Hamadaea sp. NPDC050747]|uniref:helix-turn-helix domain-containing protein n=1 Tax=Hamadaea sp. NPDC050747 TaxID=3155789 RepID=UPI0033BFFDA2
MTPEQTAAASRPSIEALGSAWTRCPRTLRHARELGLSAWVFTVAGRAGALGDVDAHVAASALGQIHPDAVREAYESAAAIMPVPMIAAERMAQCCRWGRDELTGLPGLPRFVVLTRRILRSADATAMPLYAAWRRMPVPDDAPAELAGVCLYLLTELRAGAALVAQTAAGLSPVQALLSGPEGEAGAVAYGWQPPYPAVGHLARRRVWADAVADRIVAGALAALTSLERDEWLELVTGLAEVIHPAPVSLSAAPSRRP